MITVKQALEKARALYAENPDHASLNESLEGECLVSAVSQSVGGLVNDFTESDELYTETINKMYSVCDTTGNLGLIRYNAEHTTKEVLGKFDEAIASC